MRFFWFLALLLSALSVQAHDPRPLLVEINQYEKDKFSLNWTFPAVLPLHSVPRIQMPDNCVRAGEQGGSRVAYRGVGHFLCEGGIRGSKVDIRYPAANPSLSTLIRVQLHGGVSYSQILPPGVSQWQVPEEDTVAGVASQYSWLGIVHILSGYDHLLFVMCLLFIARTPRRLLLTITGFTLAHSLTLALQVMNVVTLPVAPVEAAIALSIVLLAHELAVEREDSWTWRYPLLVSSLFGLLHGFGFANVLTGLGLPQSERVAALLFFNLGVEVGQLLFIAALSLVAWGVLFRFWKISPARLQVLVAYPVGIVASYWLVERVAGFMP